MTDSLLAILNSHRDSDGDISHEYLPEEFVVVEEGDWSQDHKYQSCEDIVEHKPSGRFFCISRSRCGSYHTDWYYTESHVCEVVKVEKTLTVTTWESK